VEPKHEKKKETLDELLDADLDWGKHPGNNLVIPTVTYPELVKFLEDKRLKKTVSLY
jgi:hypothetical protein